MTQAKRLIAFFLVVFLFLGALVELSATESEEETVPAPEFSSNAGFFSAPFDLTLTASEAATIRFTTDGSIPTATSQEFTAPINIQSVDATPANSPMTRTAVGWALERYIPGGNNGWHQNFQPRPIFNGVVIRARAFYPDGRESDVVTRSFFVDETGMWDDVRVVSLAMEPRHFAGEAYGMMRNWGPRRDVGHPGIRPWPRPDWDGARHIVNFEMFETDGSVLLNRETRAWVMGQYSRQYAKRSFRFNFNQAGGDVIGMPALLLDTFRNFYEPTTAIDRFRHINARLSEPQSTGIRDALVHTLSEPLRPTIQNVGAYSALFVNGEFWGMYCLRTHRHDALLSELFPGVPRGDIWHNNEFEEWSNAYRLAAILRSHGYREFSRRVCIDDLIDYFIIGYHFGNWDWIGNNFEYWRSTRTHPVHGGDGKYRFIVQDFDRAIGARPGTNSYYDNMLTDFTLVFGRDYFQNNWRRPPWIAQFVNALFAQEDFRNTFAARYSTYTGTVFNPAMQLYIFDRMQNERMSTIGLDSYRWRYHDAQYAGDTSGWLEEMALVRTWLERRADYSIGHIREHYNRGIPGIRDGIPAGYANINWKTDSSRGFFDISGAQIRADLFARNGQHGFYVGDFSANYLPTLPIEVVARPYEGYVFANFTVTGASNYSVSGGTLSIIPAAGENISVTASFRNGAPLAVVPEAPPQETPHPTPTPQPAQPDASPLLLQIGSQNIICTLTDEILFTMDVPPQIIDGRTMVPLRFIAEFFDATVNWCGDTQQIEILL